METDRCAEMLDRRFGPFRQPSSGVRNQQHRRNPLGNTAYGLPSDDVSVLTKGNSQAQELRLHRPLTNMCSKNFNFTPWRTLIVVLALALAVRADEPPREYKVKAAFIYNFAQFVDWPVSAFNSSDAPFVVAVVGKDPFNGLLEEVVAGKRGGG